MKLEQLSTASILSLLLIILITITTTPNGVQARSLLQIVCSSSCGDISQLSYPFRLKGDPAGCGDPDYELSCENNRTIFHLGSGKYYVKNISYDKHIIRLVDVNLANGTCSLPSGSLSLDQVQADFRFRGFVALTYTKFFRCSENVSDPRYRLVPCESRGEGSYVYASSYYSELDQIVSQSCELISTVPGKYINARNPSYEAMMKALEEGFDLEWSVECRDCLVSGDSCIITTFQTPILYECDKSDLVTTIISLVFASLWIFLMGVTLIARYILCPIVLLVFLIYKCRTKRKSADTTNTENIQQG